MPAIDDALAFVACDLRDVIAGGDHVIVTGAVTSLETSEGTPLVFHAGALPAPGLTPRSGLGRAALAELGSNLIPEDNRKDLVMGAQENKQVTEDAYRAFANGDAAGAMENMDDSVVWTARGDSALTGTYTGKQEIGELWGQLAGKSFSTAPHDFIADGDKVVVLTTVTLEGESTEDADVLTYNAEGKLIAFDSLGDPTVGNRVFPK